MSASSERRRPPATAFLVAGVVLLLAAPSAFVGAMVAGSALHPASGPGTPQIQIASSSPRQICGGYVDPRCPFGSFYINAAIPYFDPASQNLVVVASPESVLLFHGVLGTSIPTDLPGCRPYTIYPALGTQVAIGCFSATNVSSLYLLDTATGSYVGNVSLGTATFFDQLGWAFSRSESRMYLITGSGTTYPGTTVPVHHLLTVDLSTRSVEYEVPMPQSAPILLALDPRFAALFCASDNRTISEIDPQTGWTLPVWTVPTGNVQSLTFDSSSGELFVANDQPARSTYVLSAQTFQLAAELPVGASCGGLVNPTTDTVYLFDCGPITKVEGGSNRVLGTAPAYGFSSGWTLGPTDDRILEGFGGSGGYPFLEELNLTGSTLPGPAYSTVPLVGANAPLALGAGSLLAGVALLGIRGTSQARELRGYRNWVADEAMREMMSDHPATPRSSR